jgi:hypothetical protein
MISRFNPLRRVGRHTFVVVVYGGSNGDDVWHSRLAFSSTTSMRVFARLMFISPVDNGSSPPVAPTGGGLDPVPVGVITKPDAMIAALPIPSLRTPR